MKNKPILPEGYTPLPYIKVEKKMPRLFLLTNFKSMAEAQKRGVELSRLAPDSIGTIFARPIVFDYAIQISESILSFLTETERQNLIPMQNQLQIIPYVPRVYRFLEQKYVDRFFETGELKLTTFADCASHENENKKDPTEGTATVSASLPNGMRIETKIGIGDNAYILCTTLNYNPDMYDSLEYDSCLVINDPLSFTREISLSLPKVTKFIFGPCSYLDKRELDNSRFITQDDFDKIGIKNNNHLNFDALVNFSQKGISDHLLFLKTKDKYAAQLEYRFVWVLENPHMIKNGIISVPNARKYCDKLKK